MEKKENQRVKLTKQMLKSSLIELMKSAPIGKITIKKICENAEINRSTFYLYYNDQYALLEEIENELIDHAQKHLEKINSDVGSLQYLEALLCYVQENAELFRILLCHRDSPEFQSAFVDASFQNLTRQLRLHCSENTADYVYRFLIMGVLSMIQRWMEAGFDFSCRDMAALIFRLADNAVSSFSKRATP